MTFYQSRSVLLLGLALLFVGFDLNYIALAMPFVPADYFADDVQRGIALSATQLGMAFGATMLAPLADRFGRRRLIMIGLAAAALGSLGAALAPDASIFIAARLFGGLASGMALPNLFVLVQELAPSRLRSSIFGAFALGFPLGAMLAGGVGIFVLPTGLPWQGVYVAAAAWAILVVVLAGVYLPESIDYLLLRESKGDSIQHHLDRIATGLRNLSIDSTARPVPTETTESAGIRALFARPVLVTTVLICIATSFGAFTNFVVISWGPTLVAQSTGNPESGATAGLLFSVGILIGSTVMIMLPLRLSPFFYVWVFGIFGAAMTVLLATSFSQFAVVSVAIVLLGAAMNLFLGSQNTFLAPLYPASARASMAGLMNGLGFAAGFLGPTIAGGMLSFVTSEQLLLVAAAPILIGAIAALVVWLLFSKRQRRLVISPAHESGHNVPRDLDATKR